MLYPEGLLAAVWYGSGEELPLGYARQLDGNGGVRVAWAWRLHGNFGIFWDFLGGLLVRHVIPRGFAVPLSGMARAKIYRRGML